MTIPVDGGGRRGCIGEHITSLKITGKLSCIRSAELGTEANVTLT
jgi:hypothetical protein